MKEKISSNSLGILIAITTAFVYGVYPAASRAVYADGGDALFMLLATTWARSLGVTLFCIFSGKKLFQTKADAKLALTGGFFQALSNLCIFLSLLYLSGPVMIIIIFSHTIMLLFFMAWRKEIALTTLAITTTVIALLGLSLVINLWRPQQISWPGVLIAFIGAITTMSRIYIYGKQLKIRNPAIVGAETFIVATVFVTALLLFKTPHLPVSPESYLYVAIGCISMALGTLGTFYGIALLGSFPYSLLAKLEPLSTILFSVVLIHETINPMQILGIVVVVSSLAYYQYASHNPR